MKYHICTLVLALLMLVGCTSKDQSSEATIKDTPLTKSQQQLHKRFDWLAGSWERATTRGMVNETWRTDDSGLIGLAYMISGADTVLTERLWLRTDGNDIYYNAHPKENPEPTMFRLVDSDSLKSIFENPEHDFPTRIAYRRIPPDSLVATISGPMGDSTREIDFPFRRVK